MIPLAAQQAFYEISAQVIPVLLLVLALGEGRVIRTDRVNVREWRSTMFLAIFATGLLLVGEMAALRALARGHDTYLIHGATVLALLYGFLFVFAQAAKLILLGMEEDLSSKRKEALGRFYMLTIAIALVVFIAILYPELGILSPAF